MRSEMEIRAALADLELTEDFRTALVEQAALLCDAVAERDALRAEVKRSDSRADEFRVQLSRIATALACRHDATAVIEKYDAALKRVAELEAQNARLVDLEFDFMEQNRALREESRWIPVAERLPDHDGPVLVVVDGCVTAFESFYAADGFEGPSDCSITHWRPLPAPPEERT